MFLQSLTRALSRIDSRLPQGYNVFTRTYASSSTGLRKPGLVADLPPSPEEDAEEKARKRGIAHRLAMKERFPEGWNPPRKISREAMENLRALHRHDPETFSTPALASRFQISPEAVRRILRSKWTPNKREKTKLVERERKRKEGYIAKSIARELETRGRPTPPPNRARERESIWEVKDELELK